MSLAAATDDGAVFRTYLERVLLPELRRTKPEAVLVMDNLAAPKTAAVRARRDSAGFAYRGPWPRAGEAGPGASTLLARPQSHRAGVGQGEGPLAQGRGADGQ
jgi:hypothetical protein